METLTEVLPVIINILLVVLLIILIILGIKSIILVNDLKAITQSVKDKVNSLNGIFTIIDTVNLKLNGLADSIIGAIEGLISKIAKKVKSKKTSEEEELDEILKKGSEV